MKDTTLIRSDELERILLETSPRVAVQRAVDVIAESIPSCSVTVMSIDADGTVRFDAARGISWRVLRQVEKSFNHDLPRNVRDIIRSRETMFIEDVADYPDWRRRTNETFGYVGFPIVIDRRVAGIINVQTMGRKTTLSDVETLRPLVHLITLIVVRYIKERQSTQRENFLALMHETMLDGMRAMTATELMNAVIQRISRRLGYQYIAILLYDDVAESLVLRAQKGYASEYNGLSLSIHGRVGAVVRAFRTRHAVCVPDAATSTFYLHGIPGGQSDAALPLMVAGKVIGVLNLESKRKNAFSREDLRNLMPLAASVGLLLASLKMTQLLREQALLDGLTGVQNRHTMSSIVTEELERARRHDRDLSLVMLDVDEFKVINDRLGHSEGDRVLQALAALLRLSLRANDKIIRYGGDEFLLVLSETSQRAAELLLERLRAFIETKIVTALGPVHVSVGIASFQGDPDGGDLVQLADKRMYVEKSRHRARLAEDDGNN
ncbi:MAG: sensor domain-containing diguanylate cyclase [Candidatus Cryosericum sp.]